LYTAFPNNSAESYQRSLSAESGVLPGPGAHERQARQEFVRTAVHRDQASKRIGWVRHVFRAGFWRQFGRSACLQRSETRRIVRLPCVVGVGVSTEEPEVRRRGLSSLEHFDHLVGVGQVRTGSLLDGSNEVPQLNASEPDCVEQHEFAAVVVVLWLAKQGVISIQVATLVSHRVGETAEESVVRSEAAGIDIIDKLVRQEVREKR
jgi:hypothetical protein